MNIIPIYDQFDGYEYDFQQDVEDIIEDTLGEDISSSQKEELADSITFLLDKYSKEYFRYLNSRFSGTNNMLFANYYPNSYNPNPMIPIPAINAYQQPPINYFPQNLIPSPAPTAISANPYQMQMFPQIPLFPFNLPVKKKKGKGKRRSNRKSSTKESKKKSKSKDNHEGKKEKKSVSNDDKTANEVKQTPVKTIQADSDGIKTFSFNRSSPSTGIIEYLTASIGDISDVISIDTNDPTLSDHPIRNILKSDSSEFIGMNKNEFTITFTFKRNQIQVLNYTIRRGEEVRRGQKCAQLKNWVFEISDDKSNWTEIDRQSNVSFEQNEKLTFNITRFGIQFVHYCRLRHNGRTSSTVNDISIRSIEFYGRVRDNILHERPTFKFASLGWS